MSQNALTTYTPNLALCRFFLGAGGSVIKWVKDNLLNCFHSFFVTSCWCLSEGVLTQCVSFLWNWTWRLGSCSYMAPRENVLVSFLYSVWSGIRLNVWWSVLHSCTSQKMDSKLLQYLSTCDLQTSLTCSHSNVMSFCINDEMEGGK